VAVTITVLSQKGGTGKTTTVRTLADAYRRSGLEVLCVDLDPQGNLSDYFDVPADASPTIADVLAGQARASDAVYADVLPANLGLAEAELVLGGKMGRELTLKRALREVKRGYDLVLVDCPPSLGLLTVNALTASDGVIVPLECECFALRGVAMLVETIQKVQDRLNPELTIDGLVATMYDSRTVHSREVLARLVEAFEDKVFHTAISRTVRFPETTVAGEPITTFATSSGGAYSYRQLAREVIARCPGT
jgi:chromosome partitioning protein